MLSLLVNKWVIGIILAAAISSYGTWQISSWMYGKTITSMQNKALEQNIKAMNRANEITLKDSQIKETISKLQAAKNSRLQVVTKHINKEVVKYVQSDDSGKCSFSDSWLRPYDAAALSVSPKTLTPSNLDATTAPVTDVEVLQNATENYHTCNAIREQLTSLQGWVRATRKQK